MNSLPDTPAPLDLPAFSLVVATDLAGGIGKDGDLPWHIPADLRWFKQVTVGEGGDSDDNSNTVIMGRRTWESIPERFRPLTGRRNIVLSSRNLDLPDGVEHARSLDEAPSAASEHADGAVFVIGGGMVYAEALRHADCRRVYLTEVDATFNCDTFLADLGDGWERTVLGDGSHEGLRYRFVQLDRTTAPIARCYVQPLLGNA